GIVGARLRFGIFRGGRPRRTASQQSRNRRQVDASPNPPCCHRARTALPNGQTRRGLPAKGRGSLKNKEPAPTPQSDEALSRIETQTRRAETQTERAQTSAFQVGSGEWGIGRQGDKGTRRQGDKETRRQN